MIEPKAWGFKVPLEGPPDIRVERLFVGPRGRSSVHRHEAIGHEFMLEYGAIEVERYGAPDGCPCSITRLLAPGAKAVVAPGQIHRFVAGPEGAVAVESSCGWSEGDIERFDEGGIG